MTPLTPRQKQVFQFIRQQIEDTGLPPSRLEIAKKIGFKSANAAEEHIKAIARKGYIDVTPKTSRGIKISDQWKLAYENKLGLPLVGLVAAGAPITAIEHIEDRYKVEPTIFHPAADFLLKIRGDSMKNIGMLDGDLLAVHKTNRAKNGQVVVARIEDEVTVKRFEKVGNTIFLHAENEEYEPIIVNLLLQKLYIEGLAVGVIRNSGW
ncbi:LexA repressor [Shewanella sairae]|uniref:LexA repressor n=1 Tax=Shewanella sairae TaxID=190310 RepID=A0ABQ4P673_9GAMM|nr:transcriptional repressor LexA [Shewanella sairae]MCL1130515.1 transcriptional repressor LexA [Shewanella sairae]GIU42976.1 LexA repressor [Shewanella sairae]